MNPVNQDWIPLDDWKDLPIGTWLVKVKKDRKPYHVAHVNETSSGSKLLIVGNYFSWDMGEPIAYASFTPYEPK